MGPILPTAARVSQDNYHLISSLCIVQGVRGTHHGAQSHNIIPLPSPSTSGADPQPQADDQSHKDTRHHDNAYHCHGTTLRADMRHGRTHRESGFHSDAACCEEKSASLRISLTQSSKIDVGHEKRLAWALPAWHWSRKNVVAMPECAHSPGSVDKTRAGPHWTFYIRCRINHHCGSVDRDYVPGKVDIRLLDHPHRSCAERPGCFAPKPAGEAVR